MTAKLESAWKQNYSDTKPRNEGKRNTKKQVRKRETKKKKNEVGENHKAFCCY